MRLGLFGRKQEDGRKALAERLKTDVRRLLGLPETAAIAVNDILCADPSCPGTETVILVMNPGEKTKAYKVQVALAEVGEDDLLAALRGSDRGA